MRGSRRSHFTFLEIMIAVAILLMVAMTLYVYSRQTTQSWNRIVNARNRLSELLTLDRTIDSVLSHAVPFTWPDADGHKTPFIVASPDHFRCAYLHRLNDADEGALRFAEFVVENQNLYLVYSDRPFLDWSETGGRTTTSLLAEGIADITFRYADWSDRSDDDWADRCLWLNTWETVDSERLDIPLAVMMTVNWLDGRTECWLRRTMGNGYRERFGKWEPLSEDRR